MGVVIEADVYGRFKAATPRARDDTVMFSVTDNTGAHSARHFPWFRSEFRRKVIYYVSVDFNRDGMECF